MEEILDKLDLKKIINRTADYAITEGGKKFILNEKPLSNFNEVEKSLNLTLSLKRFIEEVNDINFTHLPDISTHIMNSKIENYILNPRHIFLIGKLLSNVRIIKSTISQYKNRFAELWEFVSNFKENILLEKKINDALDDYIEIKDTASSDLKKIRDKINALQIQIQKMNEKILKDLIKEGIIQADLITLRDGRMVIPVRSEFKRKVRGFIHAESNSGQTTYIEPVETLELNNELLSLFYEESREISRILGLLTKDIAKVSEELVNNHEMLSKFDAHYAKAKFAIEIRGNKINFSEDRSFDLINARHPLLIQSLGYQNTVPFNFKIDSSIKGIIISGPNAGGKTVLMKTIGIFNVLSRMGYLISVHPDSKMPFFSKVFIDIGDDQSIDNDISTFGSHIRNLKYIFENCDNESLILLDELGTGTDPIQGAALANSFIEQLINKSAFLIVTTHHSHLKFFAANHPELLNASMEFNSQTLEPTYKFIQGIPGSSYTFEITRRMKMYDKIIEGAKKYLKQSDIQIENYISQLQQKIQYYTQLINELRKEKEEIQKLKSELHSKLSTIKSEVKEIKRNAIIEAEQILKTANRIVENTIKDLRQSQADKQSVKKVKQYLSEEKNKLQKLMASITDIADKQEEDLAIGDFVKLQGQESMGKIISIDKKKNQALIQIEQFKVTVALDKIYKIAKPENLESNLTFEKFAHPHESKIVPFRLDIRGKRVSEAEDMILKYIDDAVMYGLFNIEIIHGKGDGILKNLTQRILQSHPFVETFQFAPTDQGGDGITIIKLKD